MRVSARRDPSPVLARDALPISPRDDAASLHDKLAALGAEVIVSVLADLDAAQAVPQPASGITHARQIRPEDAILDWSRPASELERRVRAFRPSPGATTALEGERIKVWE